VSATKTNETAQVLGSGRWPGLPSGGRGVILWSRSLASSLRDRTLMRSQSWRVVPCGQRRGTSRALWRLTRVHRGVRSPSPCSSARPRSRFWPTETGRRHDVSSNPGRARDA